MMDRASKIAILSAMDDGHLDMALQAVGIEPSPGDSDFYGEDPANQLDKWAEMDVSVPDSGRPEIVNKSEIFLGSQPKTQVDTYGMPMPGADEDQMMAVGMF